MRKEELKILLLDGTGGVDRSLESSLYKLPGLQVQGLCTDLEEAAGMRQESEVNVVFWQLEEWTDRQKEFWAKEFGDTLLVVCSRRAELAAEAYELGAADFLLLPFARERLERTVHRLQAQLAFLHWRQSQGQAGLLAGDYFFVKSDYKIHKVDLDDILFVEGLGEYVRIVTPTERLVTLQSLTYLDELLPAERFFRIHRSYIINLDKVNFIQNHIVSIGNHQIPISKSQRKNFLEYLSSRGLF